MPRSTWISRATWVDNGPEWARCYKRAGLLASRNSIRLLALGTWLFALNGFIKTLCLFGKKPFYLDKCLFFLFPCFFSRTMNSFEQRGKKLYAASLAAGNISFRDTPSSTSQRMRDSQFTLGSVASDSRNNSSFSFHGKHTPTSCLIPSHPLLACDRTPARRHINEEERKNHGPLAPPAKLFGWRWRQRLGFRTRAGSSKSTRSGEAFSTGAFDTQQ